AGPVARLRAAAPLALPCAPLGATRPPVPLRRPQRRPRRELRRPCAGHALGAVFWRRRARIRRASSVLARSTARNLLSPSPVVVSTLFAFPRALRVSLRLVTAARPRAYQSLGRRDAHRYSHPNESIRVGCAEGGSRPRAWHSRPSLIWTRALRSAARAP